ncbi:MAG: GGDEF domain-containing protein [Acidimicrobiales bacterium]
MTADGSAIDALEAELAAERNRSWRLKSQLRNLADHDPVTDLLSRRSMEYELQEHLELCVRYGPEGAFLLVGLEGLEDIGRVLGRQEADASLANIAGIMVQRLRATDVTGRWGPLELAVIVPRGPAAGAAVVAVALDEMVRGAATPGVPAGSVRASIGVAPVVDGRVGASQLTVDARHSMMNGRHRQEATAVTW